MTIETPTRIQDLDAFTIRPASRGGWAVFASTGRGPEWLFAAVSDDEALLEFFAEQLALSVPMVSPTHVGIPIADARRLGQALLPFDRLCRATLDVDGGAGMCAAEGCQLEAPPIRVADLRELTEAAIVADLLKESNFRGPSPQPRAVEASAAAIVPPPVSAERVPVRIADLLRLFVDAPGDRIMQVYLGDLRDMAMVAAAVPPVSALFAAAVEPFANLARVMRDKGGVELVTYRYDEVANREAEIELSHVHALLLAAGLFTDDMRPSQPTASQDAAADASAEPAGAAPPPPPADADDDGCPVSDPDCMGRSGDCHDACVAPWAKASGAEDPL